MEPLGITASMSTGPLGEAVILGAPHEFVNALCHSHMRRIPPPSSSDAPRIKRQTEHAITCCDFAVGIAGCIDFAKAKPREKSHGSMIFGRHGCVKRPDRELGIEKIYRRDARLSGDAATPECGSEHIGEVRSSTRVDGRLHIAYTSIGRDDSNHPVQPELRPVSG